MMEPEKEHWDAIVVGTGVAGATLGWALAKAGRRVLFVERGRSTLTSPKEFLGNYAEMIRVNASPSEKETIFAQAGRWTEGITDRSFSENKQFLPFLGQGTGGSHALSGVVMERFFPIDFNPRESYRSRLKDETLPEWPIQYSDLQSYYTAAEALYRVRGGPDPLKGGEPSHLRSPTPLLPVNEDLFRFFQQKDLHPYRLAIATESVPGCNGCQGFLCEKGCKNDSAKVCLEPALTHFNAQLLDESTVLSVETQGKRVIGTLVERQGQRISLRGDYVILAAGALRTPLILLQSAGPEHPQGLANRSGQVGRNLMRHLIDLYLVKSDFPPNRGDLKQIGFNDLYFRDNVKLGTVQSFGDFPPIPVMAGELKASSRFYRGLGPLLRWGLEKITHRKTILAAVVEDLPHPDNRVWPAPGGEIMFRYRINPGDQQRRALSRGALSSLLKPKRFTRINQAENNKRLAHVCGTCRFGHDPKDSVLDADNRAHDLDNLYVVDASFFPTSGGTNPSLTIAANALRVADKILARWPK